MITYATLADASSAVQDWNGNPTTLQHLGDSGSSVFSFHNSQDRLQILRLTDATFRTRYEVEAELAFLAHLKKQAVPVAAGVQAKDGAWTRELDTENGKFVACVLEYAEGEVVKEGSPYWGAEFFRAWGRNLALVHQASESYVPEASTPRPWDWENEILFREAEQLIPAEDVESRLELNELLETCHGLARTRETFGVIHADHGPQNFHYAPTTKTVTAFDFGNACYHWFVSDVAIALSTVRAKPNREDIRRELLAGYREIRALPSGQAALIPLFMRLRSEYVYLDRLYWFAPTPTTEQMRILETLKARVHSRASW